MDRLDKICLSSAHHVSNPFDQLLSSFHTRALKWVNSLSWTRPHLVPIGEIDTSNKSEWNAYPGQKGQDEVLREVKSGLAKPIILVKPKGKNQYIIVDGHHRTLAAMQLKKLSILAWTADAPAKFGPWDTLHSAQIRGSSAPAVKLAADSLEKASTLQPVGPKPLWHKKGPQWHLPAYVQHIANALIKNGHSESNAIQIAVGVVKRWASGGGHVDANTRAAASKAVSEWNALKAAAHGSK